MVPDFLQISFLATSYLEKKRMCKHKTKQIFLAEPTLPKQFFLFSCFQSNLSLNKFEAGQKLWRTIHGSGFIILTQFVFVEFPCFQQQGFSFLQRGWEVGMHIKLFAVQSFPPILLFQISNSTSRGIIGHLPVQLLTINIISHSMQQIREELIHLANQSVLHMNVTIK